MAKKGFQTMHNRTPAQIQAMGYIPMEDGRWMTPDGESFLDTDQITQLHPLVPDADPLIDGMQYRNIEGFANNDPDPAKALRMETDYLRGFGINPVNDPEYGWIVPQNAAFDQAHDPNYAQNHESGFDKFLGVAMPGLIGAGMTAGIGAGLSGLFSGAGAGAGAGFEGANFADLAMETAPGVTTPVGAAGGAGGAGGYQFGNYTDPWASGNAEVVANSGVAGDTGGMAFNPVAGQWQPSTQAPAPVESRTTPGATPGTTVYNPGVITNPATGLPINSPVTMGTGAGATPGMPSIGGAPGAVAAGANALAGGAGAGGGAGSILGALPNIIGAGSGLNTMFNRSDAVDPAMVGALWKAGQNTYNTSLDPQGDLYRRTQQQLAEQVRASQSVRGTAMSPFAAGIENKAMSDFNIDWQNQQLQRQTQGAGAFAGAGNVAANAGIANNAQAFLQNQTGLNNLTTALTGTPGGMSYNPATGQWGSSGGNPGLISQAGSWLSNLWGGGTPNYAPGTTPTGGFNMDYFGAGA